MMLEHRVTKFRVVWGMFFEGRRFLLGGPGMNTTNILIGLVPDSYSAMAASFVVQLIGTIVV